MPKQETDSKLIQETLGVVFLFASILLFLALISFDPKDLPFWSSPPNNPVANFIGPFGAYLGGGLFLFFGYAAFALPLVIIGMAVRLVLGSRIELGWGIALKLFLGTILLIALACFLQLPFLASILANPGFNGWPGGWIGYQLINVLAAHFIGNAGALIIILLSGSVSFIFLYDISPKAVVEWIRDTISAWLEERRRRRLEAADPIERMELEGSEMARRLAREEREMLKRFAKQGLPPPPKDHPDPASPLVSKPTIVDATQPEPAPVPPEENEPRQEPAAEPEPKPKTKASTPVETLAEPVVTPAPQPIHYQLPKPDLLTANDHDAAVPTSEDELHHAQQVIIETLRHFKITVEPGQITRGATITVFEVKPAPGIRVERIANLDRNLARALKAEKINILAPIPGKDTVGIEVGNTRKVMVRLREIFESETWRKSKAQIPIATSKDVYGRVIIGDLAEMPHLLVAGTTGSGKSVFINCLVLSLIYKFKPEDLRLILVDPKVVELQVYNRLPHLAVPVVTETKKVLGALKWAVDEMERRYRWMAKTGVRNIVGFNNRPKPKPTPPPTAEPLESDEEGAAPQPELFSTPPAEDIPERLPYVVVIIDELADLMQTAPAEVELAIARLSAKARAAGIHLVLATQTPRANVITGVIKANVPSRVAFQVNSALDSRVILDENGAENLLGKGDCLYLPPGTSKAIRGQCPFVSETEVTAAVDFIATQAAPSFEQAIQDKIDANSSAAEDDLSEKDLENYNYALEILRQERDAGNHKASTSMLQRRLKIGYNTAAGLIERLHRNGIIEKSEDGKSWEITPDAF
ncbi:MAG: hypothetical protein OHK005_11390 [Candidatus Methylacidiphilales bacterium]